MAINTEDPRYAHLHGCHVVLPLVGREIPIVCDEHADMEKGTGVVKITPAHDPNDFEVGQRHGLPMVRVLTYEGRMTGAADRAAWEELKASGRASADEPEVLDCGKYAGMTAAEARKAILADLEAGGYLKATEDISHEVGTCYRCHTVIEPMISRQWFVKMEPLALPAIESVEKGEIKFVPERFTKNYINWMKGSRDWCISRQLWWGHRIPAWYCAGCGETIVAKTAPATCPPLRLRRPGAGPRHAGHLVFQRAVALQHPGLAQTDRGPGLLLSHQHPGHRLRHHRLLVSRMIFSGLAYTGKAPFDTVLIHGLVRDAQGRKMSKSLGNGIDPLEVIRDYGADALRLTLVLAAPPATTTRFSDEKIKASRNFANKLWNAARFVMMNLPEDFEAGLPAAGKLDLSDKWVLSRLNHLARAATENLEKFELGLAAQKIQDFIWRSTATGTSRSPRCA